jgi:hypothetical protein
MASHTPDGDIPMGLMICRWGNSIEEDGDGIYYAGAENLTLFEIMEGYLAHGQTVEVLNYDPDHCFSRKLYTTTIELLDNERRAHGEKP